MFRVCTLIIFEAISAPILEKHCDLSLSSLTRLISDGASVMVRKRSGIVARLKQTSKYYPFKRQLCLPPPEQRLPHLLAEF
jgi:hypothetical protein